MGCVREGEEEQARQASTHVSANLGGGGEEGWWDP